MDYESATPKVLIMDDDENLLEIVSDIVEQHTEYDIKKCSVPEDFMDIVLEFMPDVILMDIIMPNYSGYELAEKVKSNDKTKDIPIIFMTGLSNENSVVKAFHLGGIDYITKPFRASVLIVRLNAHIKLKKAQDELKYKNMMLQNRELHLAELVNKKTTQISQITLAMVSALEDANFYNDNDTGNHIKRVSEYSVILADGYGCDKEFSNKIKLYSSLHDVGKIGVPFHILNKPGKLVPEEFEEIKNHVIIGFKMLNSPGIDQMAKNIILYHHEKWDGTGYPYKLKGEDIPIEARIVSLADVYDALIHTRVYKEAYTSERTEKILRDNSGIHFDPTLIDVFFKNIDTINEIRHRLR